MPTLEFKGKQHVYAHHLTVPYRPLVPDPGKSLHPADVDDNLILHGDNLHALKALLPRYAGKIKCIYIDPPYNTGNEGWIYNDNVNSPLMQQWLAANGPVDGEDLERHDKWLCMMWPRLHLLRELLADDGVIFVSIDDNEQHHLRMLMDEIFGEGNFVACLTWVKKQKTSGVPPRTKAIPNKEYILVYRKQQDFSFNGVPGSKESYRPDREGNYYRTMPIQATGKQNNYFSIINPQNGNSHYGNWAFSEERIKTMIKENLIIFPNEEHQKPTQLVYYDEHKKSPIFHHLGLYDSEEQTKKFKREHPGINFDFPKPVSLLEFILSQSTTAGTIVLDSFAGSGTTAQAVLALNKEDGGNRKFILVECEDYADTVTAERVRRVINGVPGARDKALQEGLGGSFTYCTLGNPIDVEGMLTGESLPDYAQLAAYLLHTAAGLSASGGLDPQNDDGLFYRNGDTDYYLLYRPEIHWLRSNEAVLNEQQARRIHAIGRKARVFAADKFMSQRFLADLGITFCQIPYELHRNGSGGG